MAVSNSSRTMLTGPDLYYAGPAHVLKRTRGLVFPIQPDIVYQQAVNYQSFGLTHTNYHSHSYAGTPSPSIQVTAQFSNVTQEEHEYTQGVIHFLRSVTKMFYGIDDVGKTPVAGTPPPKLRFSSFGTNQFYEVPVLVGSVSIPYQSDTDLVEIIDQNGNPQALPAIQTISLDLLVSISPAKQKKVFSKHKFINGSLYSGGFI
tara:strand:- start:5049 stop:5657 length:609 start_codon:yes stop_codon:yes gene_type:complete